MWNSSKMVRNYAMSHAILAALAQLALYLPWSLLDWFIHGLEFIHGVRKEYGDFLPRYQNSLTDCTYWPKASLFQWSFSFNLAFLCPVREVLQFLRCLYDGWLWWWWGETKKANSVLYSAVSFSWYSSLACYVKDLFRVRRTDILGCPSLNRFSIQGFQVYRSLYIPHSIPWK